MENPLPILAYLALAGAVFLTLGCALSIDVRRDDLVQFVSRKHPVAGLTIGLLLAIFAFCTAAAVIN